jgi:hypothetical protein
MSDNPTDPLSVLGHEVRMDILRALAEADGPVSFSRLRERVGLRDSGTFNYHLQELCRYFVRETREGYELGDAGSRVIGAAGGAAAPSSDDETTTGAEEAPAAADESCPVCGERDCERLFHVHLGPAWLGGRS